MVRKPAVWAMGGILLTGMALPSIAEVCPDPLLPPCCPSPCPVVDLTRVAKLVADVDSVKQSIALESQIVQSAHQMNDAIGGVVSAGQSLGMQLNSVGSLISGEITTLQSSLPTNPAAALGSIERSLFVAPGTPQTVTQYQNLILSRQVAAQAEEIGGYAVSLMRSTTLSSVTSRQSPLATPTTTQQLRGDMASNSLSRLATYQSIGNIHQLVAAWVSQRSADSALRHSSAEGPVLASTSVASVPSTYSAVGTAEGQAAAQVASQLISLHDARVEARALLSSYPALQQTIASAAMAQKFADDAKAALTQSLMVAGVSGMLLTDIQNSLLSVDQSGWLDNGKTARSQQAAAAVLTKLSFAQVGSAGENPAAGQVQSAMASWLDADKQSRYWAALSGNAQQVIGMLDIHLGSLSDRVGVDVASASAASKEQALLSQLSRDPASMRWSKLIFAARQDPSAWSVLTQAGLP